MAATCMIQLTFVYIFSSLYIKCVYKNHTKVFSVSQLYTFCKTNSLFCTFFVACMYKKHTFQESRCFQCEICTRFVQFVLFLYIWKNLMYIFCTWIITQNLDLYYTKYQIAISQLARYLAIHLVFCIIFLPVYILYSSCKTFLVRAGRILSLRFIRSYTQMCSRSYKILNKTLHKI